MVAIAIVVQLHIIRLQNHAGLESGAAIALHTYILHAGILKFPIQYTYMDILGI